MAVPGWPMSGVVIPGWLTSQNVSQAEMAINLRCICKATAFLRLSFLPGQGSMQSHPQSLSAPLREEVQLHASHGPAKMNKAQASPEHMSRGKQVEVATMLMAAVNCCWPKWVERGGEGKGTPPVKVFPLFVRGAPATAPPIATGLVYHKITVSGQIKADTSKLYK